MRKRRRVAGVSRDAPDQIEASARITSAKKPSTLLADQSVQIMTKHIEKFYLKDIQKISILFLSLKLAQLVLITATPAQFDVSSKILLQSYASEKAILSTFHTSSQILNGTLQTITNLFLDRFVDRLVTWDAVYFSDLFTNGIQYEHQFVFCPLWWRLVHAIPVNPLTQFYSRLIWAALITNTCHFLAAVVLYFYTLEVFSKARIFSPKRMAVMTLALFVVSPAAAFLTAPYSEAIAALCSFLCLYLRELSVGRGQISGLSQPVEKTSQTGEKDQGSQARVLEHKTELDSETHSQLKFTARALVQSLARPESQLYLASGLFAALAFGFRANCLFLGLIYIYDLFYRKTQTRFLPLISGLVLGLAFVLVQIYGYVSVCSLDRGEWCDSAVPSLFAYLQSHYWGNGFLKYWTPNNIPNFVFGAPTIMLLALAIRYFAQTYPVERILPVLAVNVVFLVLVVFFWHVQIVTRIHTFLPVVYWLLAGLLTQPSVLDQKWGWYCVVYLLAWNILQPVLFAAFLPPA